MSEATLSDAAAVESRSWFHRNQIAITPWLFLAPGVLFFLFYVIFAFSAYGGLAFGLITLIGTGDAHRLFAAKRH